MITHRLTLGKSGLAGAAMVGLLPLLLGCAKIDYIGDSFEPTDHVDIFFDEADVEFEYRVIGRLIASAESDESFYSNEKLVEKIKEKAREHGGDAVIVLGFDIVPTGTKTTRESTTTEGKKETRTTETTSEQVQERRQIEAIVIRYKRSSDPAE